MNSILFREKFIVIRAKVNGGKTTTAGLLFLELIKGAASFWIFDSSFNLIGDLIYGEDGELYDFIGVVELDGKLIVVISQGDDADVLESLLDGLSDNLSANGIKQVIDVIVCCARSRFIKNSTIEMLTRRTDEANRFEIWTAWDENLDNKLGAKKKVVEEIISKIKTL
ncbi:hypothetical protein AAHN97_26800 [Chitinophaga niabensis]|uniref:hypothetical protein n=1 Tax=Chitinophaga niabensis TaxID=536979 RepID=UPI0031BAB9EE